MSILTRFILKKFLLTFFIVLVSLELFFVGIDFLQNFKKLPDSANLQILYILYNSFFTLTLALPLSLVFAWIVTLVLFIKNNELVALSAIGTTKKQILKPVVIVSVLIVTVLVSLQATSLAYASDQKKKILKNQYFSNFKTDVFLKYNDKYIYFKKLLPLEKRAETVYIYQIENDDIVQSIIAKKAYFQNNRWYVVDAEVLTKPANIDLKTSKIEYKYEKFLHTLEDFKPKILDNVLDIKASFSIIDAISALIILNDQDINTQKVRSNLYYQAFIPYFIIPLILLLFVYTTLNSRFFNISKFISFSIFYTLIIWGVFYMLFRFSYGGIISPEISLLLPLFLWFSISMYIFQKKVNE
jgi:lipopolysaccharide export system permease protein